ncbi:putative glycoside hydrolase, partial [Pontiella sp.]|uniref:putative glycoside hydrolase n=1 Tax=Pontiella sp. TaxID=2837462 RepID=UPI003565409E
MANTVTSLDFAGLNTALSNNTLNVGGSTNHLVVAGESDGSNYLYSVSYTGADFDGDSTNDTLTFDVLIEGLSGTVVTNAGLGASSAAIGLSDADVFLTGQKWHVGDNRMNAGETLKFTVAGATSSVGSVAFDGFDAVYALEGTSYGHEAVIGEGTGLNGYTFNGNLTMVVSPAENPLYVTSATANNTKAQWGVGHIDFGLSVAVEVPKTTVEWGGTVDSNWNMPGNWSSNHVPGTVPFELAVLSGSNDAPVVATVVETTNSCAIQIIDGASLEVADGKLLCDEIMLDGGHLQLVGGAEVEVSGDLRVGDSSSSSMELRSGSLAVDGEVAVGNGVLEVFGEDTSIDVNDLTVSSNATLRFDFDLKPVSTIQVADHFSIAEGAKLEIDLRGYNTGGNELELITFDSVSGSFDPADITITGLGGGVVSMDGDSLDLTVIDDVAARSCALWFVATGGDGTDPLDLQVNTGRRIRNLSSPDMSYALTVDGDAKVYSASWSGSDFDGDGTNDTVSFDLRVEGFSGSTFTYAPSSMTALGSPDAVEGSSNGWGVGTDGDLDAGQTLRFSMENLSLSTPGGVLEGFVGVQLAEGSGNNHILMIGEGDDLQTQKSNFPVKMGFSAENPLLVTSAADSGVKANQVAFKLMVSELPDFLDTETGDYSHYPTGPQHRSEYPAVTNIHYPDWSWDTLPMSAGVHRNDTIPEDVAEVMANTYPMIGLGGRNVYGEANVEAGVSAVAATLKKYNPDVFTSTYKNAGLHHNRTAANAYFDEEEWTLYSLDEDGNRVYDTIRGWYRYNHNHPEMRKWWSDWCVARLEDPNIDAISIDKAEGGAAALLNDDGEIEAGSNRVKSYVSIWERLPEGDMLTGNILRTNRFGGSRELLHIFNGSYLEGWQSGNDDSLIAMSRADGICASLQLIREARVKGMIVNPNYANLNHFVLSGDEAKAMIAEGRADEVVDIIREEIQLPLAYHLITLAPYNYFGFQVVNSGEFGAEEFLWNTKPYIE